LALAILGLVAALSLGSLRSGGLLRRKGREHLDRLSDKTLLVSQLREDLANLLPIEDALVVEPDTLSIARWPSADPELERTTAQAVWVRYAMAESLGAGLWLARTVSPWAATQEGSRPQQAAEPERIAYRSIQSASFAYGDSDTEANESSRFPGIVLRYSTTRDSAATLQLRFALYQAKTVAAPLEEP
jgi:hypothetical protein